MDHLDNNFGRRPGIGFLTGRGEAATRIPQKHPQRSPRETLNMVTSEGGGLRNNTAEASQGSPRETLNVVTSEGEKGFAIELNAKKPPVGAQECQVYRPDC